ncbi:MAG: hypothetical protein RLZZ385_1271 [Pseudomonadota bacterium]|jgi:5-(carboxyamino)imidazole ribonucleotide synthase
MHIGIVGCGQLARMLALAGWPMGHSFSFLGSIGESDEAVRGLGRCVRYGPGDEPNAIYLAMGKPAVITVDKENVDVALLRALARFCPVYPDPDIIHICQHRAREKDYLVRQGVAVAPFVVVEDETRLGPAARQLGCPAILKSCEQGYDGQNQWSIDTWQDLEKFSDSPQRIPRCVLERRVAFSRELSILVVRGINGQLVTYPVTENTHQDGILLSSLAPAGGLDDHLLGQVTTTVERIMAGWRYVGVLAVECFQVGERILVNEMAPRVHNSGHWTLGGATTSQFENHLRAITGVALGDTDALGQVAMVNVLGTTVPDAVNRIPSAHVHVYNKSVRPRRKMGHVTPICPNRISLQADVERVMQAVYPQGNARLVAQG